MNIAGRNVPTPVVVGGGAVVLYVGYRYYQSKAAGTNAASQAASTQGVSGLTGSSGQQGARGATGPAGISPALLKNFLAQFASINKALRNKQNKPPAKKKAATAAGLKPASPKPAPNQPRPAPPRGKARPLGRATVNPGRRP